MEENPEWKWHLEPPAECGYYFATWKHSADGRSKRVSEFWFDGRHWWTGRSYINVGKQRWAHEDLVCVSNLVVAWTYKPKPYRGAYDVEPMG